MDFTDPDLLLIPAFSTAESEQTGKSLFALAGLAPIRTQASSVGCKFCFPVGVPVQTGTGAHSEPGAMDRGGESEESGAISTGASLGAFCLC